MQSAALANAAVAAGADNLSRNERMAICFGVTGNQLEAALLERILFWHPQAQYRDRTGTRWLIRTAEEYREDGVTYTARAIQKALKRLVAKGLIEIQHSWHRFRKAMGRMHCTYVRPVLDAIFFGPKSEASPQDASEASPEDASLSVVIETPNNETAAVAAHLIGSTSAGEEGSEEGTKPTTVFSEISKSAKSILANFQAKGLPRADLSKPLNAKGVHAEIRFWHKECWPDEHPPELNAVRTKWLKLYLEKMRAAKCTDADIVAQVERLIREWIAFGKFVHTRTGWKMPERPAHLVFMQQSAEILNYMNQAVVSTEEQALPAGAWVVPDKIKKAKHEG